MKLLLRCVLLLGLLVTLAPRVARATGRPTTFALIVTNNRSARLSRPDLRYADDDGAKYYETFRMITPETNVVLLTTFDRDTEKLFPELVPKTKAPSKVNVDAAVRELAAQVTAAKAVGPVDFYFVFAGHGDVENGKGFLELSDGPFSSDDLERLLARVPATRSHVILDSCNSFFVINARKPGGRHFLTSEEATKSLSERLPNVGVFLSTSAEAEVYEWSELQSGVFSHAVRSGLAGAADANGDGEVSYDELRAFVNTASTTIRNPLYRPQVFARAPFDRGAEPIFRLATADAMRLELDGNEHRVTVRDSDEIPWVDAHKEKGAPMTLYLPPRAAQRATVEEKDGATARVVRRYPFPGPESTSEAAIASLRIDSRGPDEMFAALYSRPFGATAFAEYERERVAEPPMALGVSADDKLRIHTFLLQASERARVERYTNAFVLAGAGGMFAGFGAYEYTATSSTGGRVAWGGFTAVSGGFSVWGISKLIMPTGEEKLFRAYEAGAARGDESMRLTLQTENDLFALARSERRARVAWRWVDFSFAALFGATMVDLAFGPKLVPDAYILPGAAVLGFGSLFGLSFIKSPAEQMAESWARDPSLKGLAPTPPSFTVKPTLGLGSVGVTGTF